MNGIRTLRRIGMLPALALACLPLVASAQRSAVRVYRKHGEHYAG